MSVLPIDSHLPGLVRDVKEGNLVLVAEPGAGKTTRLPAALLSAGVAGDGEIVVLQPRRLAARMGARWVAGQLGEQLGRRVGYQVRFEDRSSRDTRLRFVTEGVLTRKLTADPDLTGVNVVVLDEFHERSLQGDLALAMCRRLQTTSRPQLRLVVMSATLDAEPVGEFLDARVRKVPGRSHEIRIEHADRDSDRPLEARVASALARLTTDGLDSDVLVFLPGAAEIRRAARACAEVARRANLEVVVLHGDLPHAEQDRAVSRGKRPKLILSTNLAETSLTIEGVGAVIDSGLARLAAHSPFSGLPTLEVSKISRASATQRAGRAGRLRAGRCLRLYTKHDHDSRPAHDKPEIARLDLAEAALTTAAHEGLGDADFFEAPPRAAWDAAHQLLTMLGALDGSSAMTGLGRRMLQLPLHPRLSRLMLEARSRGVGGDGALLASLLSERDIWRGARTRFDEVVADLQTGPSDLLDRLERFEAAEADSFSGQALRRLELDAGAVKVVARSRDRLVQRLSEDDPVGDDESRDEALGMAVLSGFGDRVARRRQRGSDQLVFASGGSATQSEISVVRDAQFVTVLDAAERRGMRGGVMARLVSSIEPEWLLELFPQRVTDASQTRFDEKLESVVQVQQLAYEGMVLDESRNTEVAGENVEKVLFEAARQRGLAKLWDLTELQQLQQRIRFGAEQDRALALPEDLQEHLLRAACVGKRSFAQLAHTDPGTLIASELGGPAMAALERIAPKHVELPDGRRLKVQYEHGKPPWVKSRLQDFFGMARGPQLRDVNLVLHLLAPNQRAVQVTTDLAGFWERHYPALRKQLMRRYPRHAWPEDPLSARPPAPRRRRR